MTTLILLTDVFEKLILFILIGLSIWSVSIMIDRRRIFKFEFSEEIFQNFSQKLIQCSSRQQFINSLNQDKFLNRVFASALAQSSDSDSFEKSLSGVIKIEKLKLEKGLSVLATLGSNAPFIGLFGTVLGIIRSFAYLGTQSGSSAVMSGVSQALYATAMGLLVAIPAVIANNYFAHQLRSEMQKTEALRDQLVAKKIL